MYDQLQKLIPSKEENEIFRPVFFNLSDEEDKHLLTKILKSNAGIKVFDDYFNQLKELIKLRNPSVALTEKDYTSAIEELLDGDLPEQHGLWVYYPWTARVVHMLDEKQFIEVRTSRNQYKITNEEREKLSKLAIGIIGLSVGQSIALTMAMERTVGTLKLADFDVLELSNLNRIRTGVHNLGLSKVVNVAREIAEIDPYLKVELFNDGITKNNLDDFLLNNKLDIVVDECDNLGIKIMLREAAKRHKIPVIMDTSDRGMIDIERFDLEPERPVFHGILKKVHIENPHQLTREEHIQLAMAIAGGDQISDRAKLSLTELGKTITTWPQLASSVVLGGAVGTDVCRRIGLGQLKTSGRFYIDLDLLIADKK